MRETEHALSKGDKATGLARMKVPAASLQKLRQIFFCGNRSETDSAGSNMKQREIGGERDIYRERERR